jgi:polyisoprenoid-binding protein YceI
MRTVIAGIIGIGLLATFTLRAADQMTVFNAKTGPGMKMRLEGTSTIHDWQVEGPLIGGFMEVGPKFPTEPGQAATPGKMEAKVEVFIPVRSLKSIEKDGSPYSDKMNEVMYDKLKQSTNPRILFHLTDIELKEAAKAKDAPYVFEAKGDLAVAGKTNKITMPVNITPLGDKQLKVNGTVSIKMSDYGVEAPVLVGILSTGDEVKLKFDWMLVQKAAPAAASK